MVLLGEYITPNVPLVSLTNVPDISLLNVPLFTGCNLDCKSNYLLLLSGKNEKHKISVRIAYKKVVRHFPSKSKPS